MSDVTNRAFLLLSTNIFSWFIENLFLPDKTVEPLPSSPSCSTVLDDIIHLHTDSATVSASSRTTTDRNIAEKLFTMIPLIRYHSLGSQHAPGSDIQKGELAHFLPDFFLCFHYTRSPSAPQCLRDGAAVQLPVSGLAREGVYQCWFTADLPPRLQREYDPNLDHTSTIINLLIYGALTTGDTESLIPNMYSSFFTLCFVSSARR